jgi:hypothetical protein
MPRKPKPPVAAAGACGPRRRSLTAAVAGAERDAGNEEEANANDADEADAAEAA